MNSITKYKNYFAFAIIFTAVLLSCFSLHMSHNWGGDFSWYILQAKSIFDGTYATFIESNRFIIDESPPIMSPLAYPWGLPLLLTPVYALFGDGIFYMKFVGVVCFILLLVVIWQIFKNKLHPFFSLLLLTLFAWNRYFYDLINNVMSDSPFLLFSTCSILLIERIILQKKYYFSFYKDSLMLVLAIFAAYTMRDNGLLLLIVLAFAQAYTLYKEKLFRPNRSQLLALLAPYGAFLAIYILWRCFFPAGTAGNISAFSLVTIDTITFNISYNIRIMEEFFQFPQRFGLLVYGTTIPFACLGIYHNFRKDFLYILYCAMVLGLFTLWPYQQHLRYIFPIVPFYFYFCFVGLEEFAQRLNITKAIHIILSICVACMLLQSAANAHEIMTNNREIPNADSPYSLASKELFTFIKAHTAPKSIIVFFKPRVMRLLTERTSVDVPDINKIFIGDYLCVHRYFSPYSNNDVLNLIENKRAELVFQNNTFLLFKLNK